MPPTVARLNETLQLHGKRKIQGSHLLLVILVRGLGFLAEGIFLDMAHTQKILRRNLASCRLHLRVPSVGSTLATSRHYYSGLRCALFLFGEALLGLGLGF